MQKTTLKDEVLETLRFFAQSDMNAYGKLTESTKEAFRVQGVKIPKEFQSK